MAYASWSVVFGEQPSAAKWNILGTNDADFNTKLTRAGMVVQEVVSSFTAVNTTTTTIPGDDTIPQNTEGGEFMTLAITPISATNKLIITTSVMLSVNAVNANLVAALFQDTTANAIAASVITGPVSTGVYPVLVEHSMVAGTTSSTTFKVRGGSSSAGTCTFNGSAGGRLFGAITKSQIKITEIVV